MSEKNKIYDTSESKELSLDSLIDNYKSLGVTRIIYKSLSPNDNSKNQPYMAGHITDLGFLPTGEVTESSSISSKTKDPKRKIKYSIELDYLWVSSSGQLYSAPNAKLIYYPQYPEVRLSGFVAKCDFDMDGWMDPIKKGRAEGRVLFFGITKSEKIIAYLATPDSRIAREIKDYPSAQVTGVLQELNLKVKVKMASSKDVLLEELKRIHLENWIESKKLNKDGVLKKYTAQNGGGYTLEAELGITPNGYADPDFMGWEVKQFGVKRCELMNSKVLTLMTPEPDGGYYVEHGVEAFIRKYGYENTKIMDRMDFTGRHIAGEICEKSKLKLVTIGYDHDEKVITDAKGCIALLDDNDKPASLWTFSKLMGHWKRKHAKAVYIPSLSRKEDDKSKSYRYCNNIRLFEGTTFPKLLEAVIEKHVYYDPGIKLENASTAPKNKRRSQFRIKSKLLNHLYEKEIEVDLLSI